MSLANWKKVIKLRSAASGLGYAGFVSYGWKGNYMHESAPNRLDFEDLYIKQSLP